MSSNKSEVCWPASFYLFVIEELEWIFPDAILDPQVSILYFGTFVDGRTSGT